jgi:hypothetical protein
MSNILDTLADRLELTDLLARLARGIDRGDRELVTSCYTEDSFDDHGGFRGTGAEFAAYICGGSPISKTAKTLQHVLGQTVWDIEGDEAFGETAYGFDMVTSEDKLFRSFGRYVDYFKKVDGTWLLHYRRVVSDWGGIVEAEASPSAGGQIGSTRDTNDPSYDRRSSHQD